MPRAENTQRILQALGLLLACALLAWVYAPGVRGPAVFDDLVVLSAVDGAGTTWTSALDALSRDDSGPFGRPVAIASFILEDRLLGDALAVSKAVNIALHCINLLLLTWLYTRLLAMPAPCGVWIALLAASAWAFAPLQVSTTLYAVQRMAILSATFSLTTLLLYDYWRRGGGHSAARTAAYALATGTSALLAVLAKENALVLPLLILLLELAWYRFADARGAFDPRCLSYWLVAVAVTAVCGALFVLVEWTRFSAGYGMRDFTLVGRLLAEGTILWDYLGQLLWPDVQRLGLYHDDAALHFPTAASPRAWLLVLSWPLVLLLPLVLWRYRLAARLAACLALYFVAHLTESTVIPLELYFEHRNYLPAVFVFLAVGCLLAALVERSPALLAPVGALLSLVLLLQLSATSVQVQLWSSESLWRMAQLRGHPQSYRANADMAVELAAARALDGALEFSRQAHALKTESALDYALRNVLLDCMAGGTGGTVAALPEAHSPLRELHTLRMLVSLREDNACPALPAGELADRLAQLIGAGVEAEYPVTYFLLALLDNALGNTPRALDYLQRYLARAADDADALLMQLHLALADGRDAVAAGAREALAALDARGALSAGQRATLELYREPPP